MQACDPNDPNSQQPGGFVYDDPDTMQNYTYMTDHMGNVVGLVDSATGQARRQVFDAFGVNVLGYITFQCAADHDYADQPWHGICCGHAGSHPFWNGWWFGDDYIGDWEDPDCPLPSPPEPGQQPRPWCWQAQPVERMQTGSFNWRGGEGSITDRALEDMEDSETHELRWSAYTRPSTGLIYMGARYYEPETGRFTQPDPQPYGIETFTVAQNNRWVYCVNDPVNGTDPSGRAGEVANLWAAIAFVMCAALSLITTGFNAVSSLTMVGALASLLSAVQAVGGVGAALGIVGAAVLALAEILMWVLLVAFIAVVVWDIIDVICKPYDDPCYR